MALAEVAPTSTMPRGRPLVGRGSTRRGGIHRGAMSSTSMAPTQGQWQSPATKGNHSWWLGCCRLRTVAAR
ncbi:hypothetical protein BHM03_00001493 [Ensete ventricosum]|nr:hypothetical protein BHM03_00001493 [Ensete ventricosum]